MRSTETTNQQCYGGHSVRETPGHIPNPEAKPYSADGTARGTVWESRTPPDSTSSLRPTRNGGPEHFNHPHHPLCGFWQLVVTTESFSRWPRSDRRPGLSTHISAREHSPRAVHSREHRAEARYVEHLRNPHWSSEDRGELCENSRFAPVTFCKKPPSLVASRVTLLIPRY